MFYKWILFILVSLNVFLVYSVHRQDRVVKGKQANEGQFPFMVSILRTVNAAEFKLCGGTIIEDRWILTAAHCIINTKVSKLKVYAGSLTYGKGTKYDVESGFFHRNYKEGRDDIALLKLAQPIKLTRNVKPIAINENRDVPNNKPATLIGWGLTSKPRSTNKLFYASVMTRDCTTGNILENVMSLGMNKRTTICTSTDEGTGACSGDSGGPLVMDGLQVGIVSRGEPCATGYPDIYTNVAYYIDWIKNATENK